MRIGIMLPFRDRGGPPLDGAGVAARAHLIEVAGFDGAWIGDASFRGLATWPDPLAWLLCAAYGSERLELGTAIYQVPLRPTVDVARRFLTLEALFPGRFSIGVGPGSTRAGHEAVGVAFEDRVELFHAQMATIRRLCDGEQVGAADLAPWPSVRGGPRFLLGAWGGSRQLARAVRDYDGWLCSAGRTTARTMVEGIARYRDLGGRRAIVASCRVDLSGAREPLADDEPFNLICSPAEAAERLQWLCELGFDDVLLNIADPENPGIFEGDLETDRLAAVRALLAVATSPAPRGARPPRVPLEHETLG